MPHLISYQGKAPYVHPDAFIADNAVLIGDVTVKAEASIWYGCVLRGDVAPIVIGEQSNIQDGTVIHTASVELSSNGEAKPTLVGKQVTVGHMALLHACVIEDLAFVGMKSCVMDGAIIKTQGMLGAGGLLTPFKTLPTGELWAGSPAKLMRPLKDTELAYFIKSADQYVKLAKSYA